MRHLINKLKRKLYKIHLELLLILRKIYNKLINNSIISQRYPLISLNLITIQHLKKIVVNKIINKIYKIHIRIKELAQI